MTTIYVVAYPKSGSSWLSRLLGDVLNSPVGAVFPSSSGKAIATEGKRRNGNHYIRQGHPVLTDDENCPVVPGIHKFAWRNITTEKVILMLRDPRDIIVSGAHHWDRQLLDYIHCVGQGKWPMTHGGGLVPWVETWLYSGIYDCVVKYEDLLVNTEGELRRILAEIDVSPVRDIHKAIERQSFAKRKAWTREHGDSLNYGKQFQLRFLRKGISGDWKNHFGQAEIGLCEKYFGSLMDDLGYVDQR